MLQAAIRMAVCLLAGVVNLTSIQAAEVDFEHDVTGILIKRCLECHQAGKESGGLSFSTAVDFRKGGESGAVVDLRQPLESHLLERVTAGEMPPERRGKSQKLPDAEIAILTDWLRQGAAWPDDRRLDLFERTSDVRGGRDWWSLQPVRRPEVPVAFNQHPVDAFIRQKLSQEHLQPAPAAPASVLIRRLHDDLTGLPPSAEEIAYFEKNRRPEAWNELVEQQLASTHFGERWARYWLDVVRFAETSGYERDQTKPFAWKYRDWVVNAFNTDMPYDQFVIQQLAGDEIPNRNDESLIATGFLRLGTWNDEPNDPEDYVYDRLEDLVHSTSSAFMGMTVKCARCHDHKFDPIPQQDYYRMAGIFWPGPIAPRDRNLLGGPSNEELGATDVLAWTDVTKSPAPVHLLKNGDRHHPLQEVVPASLSFVPDQFHPLPEAAPTARGTERRLQFAQWIASRNNPLTARVIVNRIWQGHFGKGLVRSPNNFGFTGDLPTHPELLDWLASELMDSGWSLKHVHRLILTSETYRQSADHPQHEAYSTRDFNNQWWWHADRHRRDAESMRDAMLTATGEVDLRLGGPSFVPTVSTEALEGLSRRDAAWHASSPEEQRRRTLYTFMQRSLLPPLMTTFDLCDSTLPCGQRNITTVAPQALSLLNNQFIHDRAEALASEASKLARPEDRVRFLWRRVLGREPHDWELSAALAHVAGQSQRFTNPDPQPLTHLEEPAFVREGLVLHLAAEKHVQHDTDGLVSGWQDQSGKEHHASQPENGRQPQWLADGLAGHPALRFDGKASFLKIAGELLTQPECTLLAVVTDSGTQGHREIISNWNREQNVGTSIFLGLTDENAVRWSDDFDHVGSIQSRQEPFVLTAVSGAGRAQVYQNLNLLAERSLPLSIRKLGTPWVIGQQGNIEGEFWNGMIGTILVYDRALSDTERQAVCHYLMQRYGIPHVPSQPEAPQLHPDQLAWASLGLVLLNSNEFMYID